MPGVVVTALLTALSVLVLLPSAYLFLLTVAGLAYRPRLHRPDGGPLTRFAVLVPAHDEEVLLPATLAALMAVDYPPDLHDVYVVADNCSDDTARVAASVDGVRIHERVDREKRGKGHALEWLLERVRSSGAVYDAFLFVDADTLVSPNILNAMDLRLRDGQEVVQAYYSVSDSAGRWVSSLRYAALALMHDARPRGRDVLGLSCGVFGTGMVLTPSILDRLGGWRTYGLVEDVELYVRLTEMGVRVHFAREIEVRAHMPSTLRSSWDQNVRWERGRFQVATRFAPGLLRRGLRRRDLRMVDAALEQFVPPLSLLGLLTASALGLGVAWGRMLPLAAAAVASLALGGHVMLGLASARVPLSVYRSLLFAPWFVLWKLAVYLRALMPGRHQWVRTQRPHP